MKRKHVTPNLLLHQQSHGEIFVTDMRGWYSDCMAAPHQHDSAVCPGASPPVQGSTVWGKWLSFTDRWQEVSLKYDGPRISLILWRCGAGPAGRTCAVPFCLQGKLSSFHKWYRGRGADLVSCSTVHSLSCSFCRRALCHIQLSKCMRQQSLLVARALGRDWLLTSSPWNISNKAEKCAAMHGPWFCQRPFF